MLLSIAEEMNQIVDEYVEHTEFNALLKSFIAIKATEKTNWSEMTTVVHSMFGGRSLHIERLVALTEMMILALDIMDDLQDQDNQAILWMTLPQGYVLNGIVALLMTFIGEASRLESISRVGIPPIAHEASRILMKALEGQFKDISNSIITEAEYMEMIQEKSGSLIRLAFYMGYAGSAITAVDRGLMNDLACCIGVIAQIENDIKDVLRSDKKNDLLHKKKTLPILFLLAEPDEDFPYIQEFYEDKLTEQQFIAKKHACIQYIMDSGCIEYSRVIQQLYRNEAERLLALIDAEASWKDKFAALTFAVS